MSKKLEEKLDRIIELLEAMQSHKVEVLPKSRVTLKDMASHRAIIHRTEVDAMKNGRFIRRR